MGQKCEARRLEAMPANPIQYPQDRTRPRESEATADQLGCGQVLPARGNEPRVVAKIEERLRYCLERVRPSSLYQLIYGCLAAAGFPKLL
jgi:hypothetical protein